MRLSWQQTRMTLGEVEYDRTRFEQHQLALFVRRNLSEWVSGKMVRFFHGLEGQQTHVVRLPHFFERPANAHVACQPLAAIGGVLEGRNDRGHKVSPLR